MGRRSLILSRSSLQRADSTWNLIDSPDQNGKEPFIWIPHFPIGCGISLLKEEKLISLLQAQIRSSLKIFGEWLFNSSLGYSIIIESIISATNILFVDTRKSP